MAETTVATLLGRADLMQESRVIYAHPDDTDRIRRARDALGYDEPVVLPNRHVRKGICYIVDVKRIEAEFERFLHEPITFDWTRP